MLPTIYLSDSKKRKKRKREEQFIESQRGALHKFFLASSNVDVNEKQGQEPDHNQEPDYNLNAEAKVNRDATWEQNLALMAYLRKCCATFAEAFSHDNLSDVDLDDFFSELEMLQVTLLDDLMLVPKILQLVMSVDCYPNISVIYRILLTVHVTIASSERSFSKLKLLKNCLRSTILQER